MAVAAEAEFESVAQAYISTVVVVDDRARLRYGDWRTAERSSQLGDLPTVEPMVELQDLDDEEAISASESTASRGSRVHDSHDLDDRGVIEAFADRGVVCAFLTPPLPSRAEAMIAPLASTADVVVLDWDLGMGEVIGATTTRIVARLAEQNTRSLRLVVIYTADPQIGDIAPRLAKACGASCATGAYDFVVGFTRVVVLGKEGHDDCPGERIVSVPELPARVLDEFRQAIAGLAPEFAIAALAAIRSWGGTIAARYTSDLDRAILAHRCALPDPSDVKRHLIDVFVDEVRSTLEADALVETTCGVQRAAQAAEGWIAKDVLDGMVSSGRPEERNVATLLTQGLSFFMRRTEKAFAKVVSPEDSMHDALADLFFNAAYHVDRGPLLELGVIVQGSDGGYLLCVQPVCDSARIVGDTRFPFLELRRPSADEAANLVVKVGDQFERLLVEPKLSRVVTSIFSEPVPQGGPVRGTKPAGSGSDRWRFVSKDGTFEFVAHLRRDFAQRFAHSLGAETSRVGLNEPEYIRRSRAVGRPNGAEVAVPQTPPDTVEVSHPAAEAIAGAAE